MAELGAWLDWLAAQPPGILLGAMAVLAALENVFPPIPADVMVAFGGFLAARSGASPWPSFLAIWLGNVAGAMAMFVAGRRLGRAWLARRFHLAPGGENEARLAAWHARYGPLALFVSRFLPGVRALVPPLAGALHFPWPGLVIAISAASGVWYGTINWLAFTAGNNWEVLARQVARFGRGTGLAAVALVAGAAVVLWRRRR